MAILKNDLTKLRPSFSFSTNRGREHKSSFDDIGDIDLEFHNFMMARVKAIPKPVIASDIVCPYYWRDEDERGR